MKRDTHHHIKQTAIGLGAGVLFSAIGLFIVSRELKGESIQVSEPGPLIAAVCLAILTWLIQGAMFSTLIKPLAGRAEFFRMVRLYLGSHSVGDITPFMGGEIPYEVWGLNRAGLTPSMGGAILAVKAILNFTVLVAGTVVGFVLYGGEFSIKDSGKILLGIAAGVALVWALVAFLIERRSSGSSSRDSDPPRGQSGRWGAWRQKASSFYVELRSGFSEVWRKEPRAIFVCAALHLLYWSAYTAIGALALMASGWSGNPFEAMAALLVVYLLLPLSPTPGGSGAAELGFAALIGSQSTHGSLLGGIVIWRILSYYLPLLVGAFFVGKDLESGFETTHHGTEPEALATPPESS